MERKSEKIEGLKRKFIEIVKVVNRLKSEFGEGSVWLDVPKNNYENMYIDVDEQEGVLRWWVGFGEKSYIRSYKLDIKELEKDIKEIELGLLKEIQKNLKQVVVDKFRELNQIRNEIISECGEWADKDPEKYTFPIGEFSEEVLFIYALSEGGIKWGILGKPSKTISLDYFEKDYNTLKRWFLQDLQDEYSHRLKVVIENYNYNKKCLENVDNDYSYHKECMETAEDVRKIFEDKLDIIKKAIEK